ncbi:MAG: CVNH domain-containing protein [Cyanobacteriota bacterium]|nr:CVNH domain-containing protein [Cyanobacteriota bacterium]
MKRTLLAAIGFAITCAGVAVNAPANAAPSTYQNSCRNVNVVEDVLEANCLTRDGREVYTNLRLRGIENIDGNLRATNSNRPSNFYQTCGNLSIRANVLRATCRTRNGQWRNTAIALNGIDNIDGNLSYTSDIASSYVPQMF